MRPFHIYSFRNPAEMSKWLNDTYEKLDHEFEDLAVLSVQRWSDGEWLLVARTEVRRA